MGELVTLENIRTSVEDDLPGLRIILVRINSPIKGNNRAFRIVRLLPRIASTWIITIF